MLVNTQMLDSMLSASGHTQTYGPVTVTTVTETKNILEHNSFPTECICYMTE